MCGDIMKTQLFEMLTKWRIALLFSLIPVTLMIVALVYLFVNLREDIAVYASGHQHLDFRVFYLDNIIFSENPIPRNLDFLMSYTDYIEIENGFTANFSEEMIIQYSYRAEKRMVIRQMGADAHRIVFEEVYLMSEASGETTADRLHFGGDIYTIFPKEHIGLYFEFVEDQARQMAEENVIAQGVRGFTADLLIDFTYTIGSPEFGLNEQITRGYRLPLTTEVYTLYTTGMTNFEWQETLTARNEITLPVAVIFVAVFILSLYQLLRTIKKLMADPNKYRQEVNDILRKYAYEIVVYEEPAELARYPLRTVQEFDELLKLAVNLNKHIMCYKNDTYAEFVTIVDEYACVYVINYDEGASELYAGVVQEATISTKEEDIIEKTKEKDIMEKTNGGDK